MRRWIIGSLIGALLSGVSPTALAVAATPVPAPGGATAVTPGQGLEISPPVLELSANPGQTVTASIRVRNVAAGTLIAKGRADDFSAGTGEDGKPKLLLEEQASSRHSLKQWIQSVPDLRLASQELKAATVNIRVPPNAEPGGHFGVIRFTAVPPELEGTGVALSASVGTLVLLRVAGQVIDKVTLEQFSATQDGKRASFFEHGPIGFVVRVKNEGTVHERVQGSIEVKDTFGGKTGTIAVNEKGGNVLPDSIRRFEQSLGTKPLFGKYTATLKMSYLEGGKTIEGNLSFWVIPWKLILLALLGLATLIWLLRLALRRYNDYIIAQSRKRR